MSEDVTTPPKIYKICPTVNFKSIRKNIYLPCIDPSVRNTIFKLCHEIIYVNYFFFTKNIFKDKSCPFCETIETISHLFIECKAILPLNKIVLYVLKKVSSTITFPEKILKFFDLPPLNKFAKCLTLVLLSDSRHIIWTSRNLIKQENKTLSIF